LASGARLDVQELRAGYAEVPQDAGIWWPAGQLNACGCPGITSPCMATLIRIMDEWRMTELLWWWWWFTSEWNGMLSFLKSHPYESACRCCGWKKSCTTLDGWNYK
jgi:hypothetical protein